MSETPDDGDRDADRDPAPGRSVPTPDGDVGSDDPSGSAGGGSADADSAERDGDADAPVQAATDISPDRVDPPEDVAGAPAGEWVSEVPAERASDLSRTAPDLRRTGRDRATADSPPSVSPEGSDLPADGDQRGDRPESRRDRPLSPRERSRGVDRRVASSRRDGSYRRPADRSETHAPPDSRPPPTPTGERTEKRSRPPPSPTGERAERSSPPGPTGERAERSSPPGPTGERAERPAGAESGRRAEDPVGPKTAPGNAGGAAGTYRGGRPSRRRGDDGRKDPGVAAVLSFFFAGLGQIYNGEVGKGLALGLFELISIGLLFVVVGFLTLPLVWLFGIWDAYDTAKKINRGEKSV